MGCRTPLYVKHQQASAKIVDFSGWDMPLHYGSQIEEHHKVRQDAGMFDVSHMGILDIQGADSKEFLRYVVANDVAKLQQPGRAIYGCMLTPHGGVIDDLIIYYCFPGKYRLIVNAGTREKDIAWLNQHAQKFNAVVIPRPDLSILAIQGPNARAKAATIFNASQQESIKALKPFNFFDFEEKLIARTGYTGEDGLECLLPATEVVSYWEKFIEAGISPCGLGARDTLRLEAGLNLYGSDMDEATTPLESNLTWTVAFDPANREFIGRNILEKQQQVGAKHILVGLVLEERGVLRQHQKIKINGKDAGEITSGTFSPTLGCAIAFARVDASIGTHCDVVVRDKLMKARVVKPPFVRHGKKVFD